MIAQKKPRVMPGRRKFLKAAVSGAGVAALLPRVVTSAVQAGYPNLAHLRAQHENAGIISPQKTYRMMEWEAHTPPEEHFNINLEDATRAAKDAGAESMMFYSQDHWGYAYYSSDVAVRHPHLDRGHRRYLDGIKWDLALWEFGFSQFQQWAASIYSISPYLNVRIKTLNYSKEKEMKKKEKC